MVSSRLVSTVDILPTFLDAAEVPLPHPLHGMSLRQAITPERPGREFLAAEFHFHGASPFYPRRAITNGRWKLIHNLLAGRAKPSTGIDGDQAMRFSRDARYEGTPARRAFDTFADPPEFELYDLADDPVEFINLAGESGGSSAQKLLTKALIQWRQQTDDPLLDPVSLEKMLRDGAPASRSKKGQ
jgi:N-sulfoglucosamine sulfohydrolase